MLDYILDSAFATLSFLKKAIQNTIIFVVERIEIDGFIYYLDSKLNLCCEFLFFDVTYWTQRLFFPYQVNGFNVNIVFRDENQEDLIIAWLNENIGKYRWKVIERGPQSVFFLCFRHKNDAMAFKLRWL